MADTGAEGNASGAGSVDGFGAGRLFLADSRLVLAVLNNARYGVLNRVFGVSRDQANLLSVILVVAGAQAASQAAKRMRFHVSGADVVMGGFALREAALGLAGPSSRDVPGVPALMAIAVFGGATLPAFRRATRRMRAAERRLREARIGRYRAAGSVPAS